MRNNTVNKLIVFILAGVMMLSMSMQAYAEVYDSSVEDIDPETQQTVTQDEGEAEPEDTEQDDTEENIEPVELDTEDDQDDAEDAEADMDVPVEANAEALPALNPMPASNVQISMVVDGLMLSYKAVKNSEGESPVGYVYLRKVKDGEWQIIKDGNAAETGTYLYFKDRKMTTDMISYAVVPYYSQSYLTDTINTGKYAIDADLTDACAVKYYWLPAPSSVTTTRSGTTLTGTWGGQDAATGYEFQYARNPVYTGAKTVRVSGADSLMTTVSGVKTVKYYGRVRAYREEDGKKYYSNWGLSLASGYSEKASLSSIKFNKSSINLYVKAKQSTSSSGYSVMQGGCSDGSYLYYIMENTKNDRCKIAKVRISDSKVVKVSAALNLGHGNSMTYNSKTKELVVAHNKPNKQRVSRVNASTLALIKSFDVKLPKTMFGEGVHRSDVDTKLSGIDGYIAITYIPSRNQYALQTRGSCSEVVMCDADFKPLYMITLSKKKADGYLYQELYMTDDYILVAQSGNAYKSCTYNSNDNIVFVYDYTGKYQGKITVKSRFELENVTVAGGKLYYGFHTSNTFHNYKWKYIKKVKKTKANKKKYNKKNKYKTKTRGKKYKVYKRVKLKSTYFKRFGLGYYQA